jgi:hypothetical protein
VKEFITNDELNRVLEILGLPGETLEFTVGGRHEGEAMAGVSSSWRMRATIGDSVNYPYSTTIYYVPVFLPQDQKRYDKRLEEGRRLSESAAIASGGWCAPLPDTGLGISEPDWHTLVDAALDHAIEVTKPIRGGADWVQHTDDREI